jgi:hypothetical protein
MPNEDFFKGSNAVVVPVLHAGSGEIHNVEVPIDTPVPQFHDALINAGYGHPKKEDALEYSKSFRDAAAKAWTKAGAGTGLGEAGTYFDRQGNPGPFTEHRREPGSEHAELAIPNVPRNALAVLHTHPNDSKDSPSEADSNESKALKMQGYVVSKTGLWHTDVDGKVTHVFSKPDWMTSKNPN